MAAPSAPRRFGLGKGKVFPASAAWQLEVPLRRLVESPRRIAGHLPLRPGRRWLEIGCGPGYFSAALAAHLDDGGLVLFDLQHEMLGRARAKVAAAPPVQGDATALPFRTGAFAGAAIIDVLGEVPDPPAALAEAARVVEPGGTVAVSEIRLDPDFTPLPRLVAMAEPAGLTLAGRRGGRWRYTALFTRG